MEYIRKRRWANYSNLKCKEYLRNDFSHECAYCKLQEQEVGLVGMDFFQIDHFKPQTLDFPNKHEYNNLFYSCEKCNKEKSDIWDERLLNPCEDNIFSGSNPKIIGGTSDNQYKYISPNFEGELYINTFKLNSRRQIRIRKARDKHQNNIRIINSLIDGILKKIQSNDISPDLHDLVFQLDRLRNLKNEEISKLSKSEIFEKACEYLREKNIENSVVFEEYNMDFKIKKDNITYYCELIVDDSKNVENEYHKYISIEKLNVWFEKLKSEFGMLFYYPKINRMYFYPISNILLPSEFKSSNKQKQIKLGTEYLII